MENSILKYGEEEIKIFLQSGIDNIIDKSNGKGLDNILLDHIFKLETFIEGFKNFQIITDIKQLLIFEDNYTFQDILVHCPEQAIIYLKIPSNISIIPVENVDGYLMLFTSVIKNSAYNPPYTTPNPIIGFFVDITNKTSWQCCYNGFGSTLAWIPLNTVSIPCTINSQNFNGRVEIFQNGHICSFNANVNSKVEIGNTQVELCTFSSLIKPYATCVNLGWSTTDGDGALYETVISQGKVLVRSVSSQVLPAPSFFIINNTWLTKALYE